MMDVEPHREALFNDTSDIGRWKPEVRPYTSNKRYMVSERILSA